MQPTSYVTKRGIRVTRRTHNRTYQPADTTLAEALDERRGVLFSSSFEFPGRYTRWDMGFVDPPLVFTARGRRFSIEALNERGRMLLPPIVESIGRLTAVRISPRGPRPHLGRDRRDRRALSRREPQPAALGLFGSASLGRAVRQPRRSASRALRRVWLRSGVPVRADAAAAAASRRSARPRPLSARRDPDRRSHAADRCNSPLRIRGRRTVDERVAARDRAGPLSPATSARLAARESDHGPGEYAALVERAKEAFVRGDLFEVVVRAAARRNLRRIRRASSFSGCARPIRRLTGR